MKKLISLFLAITMCLTVFVPSIGANAADCTHPSENRETLTAQTPTCAKPGLSAGIKCTLCGEILLAQEEVAKLPHTEETVAEKAPSCTSTGNTAGKKCTVCGEILEGVETIPESHEYDAGRITKDPTCVRDGERTFTCTLCLAEKVEAETKLGHSIRQVPAKAPTYDEHGWDAYEECTRDLCEYTTYEKIEALGEAKIENFDEFIENLEILENIADTFVKKVSPGKDPAMLVIKYIRTGVDRYNSGSWNIMAGYEDKDFAAYVTKYEKDYNLTVPAGGELMKVTGLKNIKTFDLPNGDFADIGHVFGLMDISYTNIESINHHDVSGWAGDTVDLLSAADQFGVKSDDVEGMVKEITKQYFLKLEEELPEKPIEGTFSNTDVEGDLDGYYVIKELTSDEYENGRLTKIFSTYMTKDLTNAQRCAYFIKNRLGGVTLRGDIRDTVYNEYCANSVVGTLEGTREFFSSADRLNVMRKAVCYVFADFLCSYAGDWVETTSNPFLTVFDTKVSTLAPGVTQKIYNATTADDKTIVYYTATADITRGDVHVHANYNNNDPSQGWAMQRVIDQANAAQKNYSNPDHPKYTENFNIVAATNGDGYNMHNGAPSGLLMMEGVEWRASTDAEFFGILKDGTAIIGTHEEYLKLKAEGKMKEAVGRFGATLVRDGQICVTRTDNYYANRSSRTAVGITKTGKVVLMVVDGRQEGLSCGASAEEVAQIMLDAGCYEAINLDGGGSSTYVAKPEGEEELKVVSNPSDGVSRSVSSSLFIASTAPNSKEFDHAVIDATYNYVTVDSKTSLNAKGVSATGNAVDMPEGTTWKVADESFGTITEDGIFTAKKLGTAEIHVMLGDEVIGTKKIFVVVPDNVFFDKKNINAIYGVETVLPVGAVYEGKTVAINENDVTVTVDEKYAAIASVTGFKFTAAENSGIRKITVYAHLTEAAETKASLTISLFSKDEASFDFDNATGGNRQFAFNRVVSNSTTSGANMYRPIDMKGDMTTSYTFALDMSEIEIPKKLEDLTYMLPGADMENASAWNFLLQLAERVSVLTTVTPQLVFDENLTVDYSKLTVSNEYFELTNTKFDEKSNTLTLTLNWKDQDQPIDTDTANPLCIVSGIKLTPKEDAAWTANDLLKLVNTGSIEYDVYLRANALYTFSQKPENQAQFDLYDFVNPNLPTERGGHFKATYVEFTDEYSYNRAEKKDWIMENGGWAYYKDGQKYVGINIIDGLYYDFGKDGINIGQKPLTGSMTDAKGNEFYAIEGKMYYGWLVVDTKNVSYFNEKTGIKETLTFTEVPSTCIIDGYADYTSSSGAQRRVNYDDAGGHEWVVQEDGSRKCSRCNYVRVELKDAKVELNYYVCTYNGKNRTPTTKVTAPNGDILTKPPTNYYDYSSKYSNNKNVGTASVTLTAMKYGMYGNLNDWFGNAAGSVTINYEIRPDLPKNVKFEQMGETVTAYWDAAMAPGVTYVIYASADSKTWTEVASTTNLTVQFDATNIEGNSYRIGTRQEVKGKVYESVTKTNITKPEILETPSIEITPTENIKIPTGKNEIFVLEATTVADLIKTVKGNVTVYNTDGTVAKEDQPLATGMRVITTEGNTVTGEIRVVVVGDIDGDAKITASDARLALRQSVKLEKFTDYQLAAADMDSPSNNEKIDASDARYILRASVNLEDTKEWFSKIA